MQKPAIYRVLQGLAYERLILLKFVGAPLQSDSNVSVIFCVPAKNSTKTIYLVINSIASKTTAKT